MGRPKVLLAGAFGQGNPGDESVLAAFVDHLEGCEVAATVGPTPARWFAGQDRCRPVPSHDRLAVARAVVCADLTVATATVLKGLHPSSGRPPLSLLGNTLALAATARVLGKPISLAGAGAAELPGRAATALARAVVGAAGSVELRDEESADLLRRSGVKKRLTVGADVVWAATTQPDPSPARCLDRPLAVFALSHLAGGPPLADALCVAAEGLAAAGYEVALQPWQAERDSAMSSAIASRASSSIQVWDPPGDVAEAAATFRGAAVVVGLRFHSLVAAGAAGAPFVAVAHEPKLAALARRLEQAAVPPAVGGSELLAASTRAAAGAPPPMRSVEHQRTLAFQTLARVRSLAFERSRR